MLILAALLSFALLNYRRGRLLHKSVDRHLRRGGDIPQELLKALERLHRPENTALYLGVISIFLGLGVMIWLGIADSGRAAAISAVPILFGLGCLLAWRLTRRDNT